MTNLKTLNFFFGRNKSKRIKQKLEFCRRMYSLILNKKLQDEKQLKPIILFLVGLVLWSVKHAR